MTPPPKTSKGRGVQPQTLLVDCSKKLKIIRAPRVFAEFRSPFIERGVRQDKSSGSGSGLLGTPGNSTAAPQTAVDPDYEYEQLRQRFIKQFPPLAVPCQQKNTLVALQQVGNTSKSTSVTAVSKESSAATATQFTTNNNSHANLVDAQPERTNIRVPEWTTTAAAASYSRRTTIAETVCNGQNHRASIEQTENVGATQRHPHSSRVHFERTEQVRAEVPSISNENHQLSLEHGDASDDPCNRLVLSKGKFYVLDADRNGNECEQVEISIEEVAAMFMRPPPHLIVPRTVYRRPIHYIRAPTVKQFGKTNVFGKPCTSYALRLDDYVFLLSMICRRAALLKKSLSITLLRLLLTQTLQARNTPRNCDDEVCSTDIDGSPLISASVKEQGFFFNKLAVTASKGSHPGFSPGCHKTANLNSSGFVSCSTGVSEHALDGKNAEQESAGQKEMFQSSRTDNAIALSAMPPASIIAYQKLMGPYITDEVFLYLIHLFEMLSGVRDPVPLETAVSEARHHLAPLTVMPRVLRDVYSYWRSQRIALGKPLLRELWPVPLASDNSPFAVFRSRTKEKMVLRRPRRNPVDSNSRLEKLALEFQIAESLFASCYARDLLKLKLCDLDVCLFEQLWKQQHDPQYVHPLWESMKRKTLSMQAEAVGCAIPSRISACRADYNSSQMLSAPRHKCSKLGHVSCQPETAHCVETLATTSQTVDSAVKTSSPRFLKRRRIGSMTSDTSRSCSKDEQASPRLPTISAASGSHPTPALSAASMNKCAAESFFCPLSITQRRWYTADSSPPQQSEDVSASHPIISHFSCFGEESSSQTVANGASRNPQATVSCNKDFPSFPSSKPQRSNNINGFPSFSKQSSLSQAVDHCSYEHCNSCLYVSPVPLPPIYLQLSSTCSKEKVYAALEMTWVSPEDARRPPIAYFSASTYPEQPAVKVVPLHYDEDVAAIPSSTESCHAAPSLLPVYRQTLDCLPPCIRHEANRRLVIPYRLPHVSCFKSPNVLNTKGASSFPGKRGLQLGSVRASLRIGRGGRCRVWLDRHLYVPPTANLLIADPIPLVSTCREQRAFPVVSSSTETFLAPYLQSNARRLRARYWSSSPDDLKSSVTLEHLSSLIPQPSSIKSDSEFEDKKRQKTTKDGGVPWAKIRLLVQDDESVLLPSAPHYVGLEGQRPSDTEQVKVNSSEAPAVAPALLYSAQEVTVPLTMRQQSAVVTHDPFSSSPFRLGSSVPNDTFMLGPCLGLYGSGFYPTGIGGPESALTGTRCSDAEPPFASALGADSSMTSGGLDLFCIPRHRMLHVGCWDDNSNKSSNVHHHSVPTPPVVPVNGTPLGTSSSCNRMSLGSVVNRH